MATSQQALALLLQSELAAESKLQVHRPAFARLLYQQHHMTIDSMP
jgi:hypothetical protein